MFCLQMRFASPIVRLRILSLIILNGTPITHSEGRQLYEKLFHENLLTRIHLGRYPSGKKRKLPAAFRHFCSDGGGLVECAPRTFDLDETQARVVVIGAVPTFMSSGCGLSACVSDYKSGCKRISIGKYRVGNPPSSPRTHTREQTSWGFSTERPRIPKP